MAVKSSYNELANKIKFLEEKVEKLYEAKRDIHIRIIGTGSAVPERILTNKDLEGIVDTSDEWITRRSGIKERRISSVKRNEGTTDLATRAALNALKMADLNPRDVDVIIVGTVTGDRQFPSAGCLIQDALGAKNAAAFDVSAGCSGFIYALSLAKDALECGRYQNALIIGVERLSSIVNWQDRGTCVLLADGAGAAVLSASEEGEGIISTHIQSDGRHWDLLYSEYGNTFRPEILSDIDLKPLHLKMEGHRLFKKAIACMASVTKESLQKASMTADDIGLVIPHQANLRIIEGLAKSLKIPMDKVFINIQKYGNTSSGTIPIALDEANRQGLIKTGTNVLLVSFGAGLTWGAGLLKWTL